MAKKFSRVSRRKFISSIGAGSAIMAFGPLASLSQEKEKLSEWKIKNREKSAYGIFSKLASGNSVLLRPVAKSRERLMGDVDKLKEIVEAINKAAASTYEMGEGKFASLEYLGIRHDGRQWFEIKANPSFAKKAYVDEFTKKIEEECFNISNSWRERLGGVGWLEKNKRLWGAARNMAIDMARYRYSSHVDSRGRRLKERISVFGFESSAIAENCSSVESDTKIELDSRIWGHAAGAKKFTPEHTPKDLAKQFVYKIIASKGHRENLLKANVGKTGLGAARQNYSYSFYSDYSIKPLQIEYKACQIFAK